MTQLSAASASGSVALMSWVSVMANHWWARARVAALTATPPGRDIVFATEAIVYASEGGDPVHEQLIHSVLDRFEWDPVKPRRVLENAGYAPELIVAGACLALLAGDARARAYLADVAGVFARSRKLEIKAAGRLAEAVVAGAWPSGDAWQGFPLGLDDLYRGVLRCSRESVLNVAHTPHSFVFTQSIHYLLPLSLIGCLDASRDESIRALRSALGPGPSRHGGLLYRRAHEPPRPADVIAGKRDAGVAAIDAGERLRIYHDGFSHHQNRWTFDPESELARRILVVGADEWDRIRHAVSAEAWARIDGARDRAIHVLAIHPGFVNVSAEARARAAARFDMEIEVAPFYET